MESEDSRSRHQERNVEKSAWRIVRKPQENPKGIRRGNQKAGGRKDGKNLMESHEKNRKGVILWTASRWQERRRWSSWNRE